LIACKYPGEFEAQHRERNATHLEIAPAIWNSLSRVSSRIFSGEPGLGSTFSFTLRTPD